MLDKIAKGAKTLPGVTALLAAAVVGGVGTAYALNDDGDEGTVTIEQVASEPTASETVAPAPVVATSEPAPVVAEPAAEPAPVVSETTAPEETTVAPKPSIAPDDPIRQTAPPPDLGSGDSYIIPASPTPEPTN